VMHHGAPKWRVRSTASFAINCRPPWRYVSVLGCSCGEPVFALRVGWNNIPLRSSIGNLAGAERAVEKSMRALGYGRLNGWKRCPLRKDQSARS